eukprot:5835479-Ditylum_brightwellii.AAC.1
MASLEENEMGFESPQYIVRCLLKDGEGVCPTGNTCCPLFRSSSSSSSDDKTISSSSCIPNDISKDKMGVCCFDDDEKNSD